MRPLCPVLVGRVNQVALADRQLAAAHAGTDTCCWCPVTAGDVVTTSVEGLGGTSNRIVAAAKPHDIRPWNSGPRIADLPVPDAGPEDVVVRLAASSVNPRDLHVAIGQAAAYMTYEFPVVLGTDLAGSVVAAGSGVTDLRPGDRVFGTVAGLVAGPRGSFAEFVAVSRSAVVRTPEGVDDASAGAFGHAAQTAWHCVQAVAARAGDLVLVHGAAGGVPRRRRGSRRVHRSVAGRSRRARGGDRCRSAGS